MLRTSCFSNSFSDQMIRFKIARSNRYRFALENSQVWSLNQSILDLLSKFLNFRILKAYKWKSNSNSGDQLTVSIWHTKFDDQRCRVSSRFAFFQQVPCERPNWNQEEKTNALKEWTFCWQFQFALDCSHRLSPFLNFISLINQIVNNKIWLLRIRFSFRFFRFIPVSLSLFH